MKLLIDKYILCDGKICGECSYQSPRQYCSLFHEDLNPWPIHKRCKSCLEAEKTAKQFDKLKKIKN